MNKLLFAYGADAISFDCSTMILVFRMHIFNGKILNGRENEKKKKTLSIALSRCLFFARTPTHSYKVK